MMPVEHQVCSHELAKRLAELGVRQESVFWWVDRKLMYTGGRASHAPRHGGIAAFTVAELGEMLPDDVIIPAKNGKPYTHWLRFGRYRGTGSCCSLGAIADSVAAPAAGLCSRMPWPCGAHA